MDIIQKLEQEELARVAGNKVIPEFAPGDTVIVNVNVVEGTRKRVQAYEGVVIGRAQPRPELVVRRAQGLERRRRRAHVPDFTRPTIAVDRGQAARRRAARQALLPARSLAASRRVSGRSCSHKSAADKAAADQAAEAAADTATE